MSKSIDIGVKCIELNNAIDEMVAATNDDELVKAQRHLNAVKRELFAAAKDEATPSRLVELIRDTVLRAAHRMEAAAAALTRH